MASYLRPRRGKKATAEAQNIILKRGEVFFETPTTGVGTGIGKIKIGDGTTAYKNLPYFLEQGGGDIVDLTQAQYNALSETEKKNGTIYSVEVGNDAQLAAKNIPFDNTGTGLVATNVQSAINGLNDSLGMIGEDGMTVHEKLDYLIRNRSNAIMDYSTFNIPASAAFAKTHKATTAEDGTLFIVAESINGNAITLDALNVTITDGTLNVLKNELQVAPTSTRPSYKIAYVANYSLEDNGEINVNLTYPNATYNNGLHCYILK